MVDFYRLDPLAGLDILVIPSRNVKCHKLGDVIKFGHKPDKIIFNFPKERFPGISDCLPPFQYFCFLPGTKIKVYFEQLNLWVDMAHKCKYFFYSRSLSARGIIILLHWQNDQASDLEGTIQRINELIKLRAAFKPGGIPLEEKSWCVCVLKAPPMSTIEEFQEKYRPSREMVFFANPDTSIEFTRQLRYWLTDEELIRQEKAFPYKINLLGNIDVGKTTLRHRHLTQKFEKVKQGRFGGNFQTEKLLIRLQVGNEDKNISTTSNALFKTYQYWDVDAPLLRQIHPGYLACVGGFSHGILFCFDLNDESSLLTVGRVPTKDEIPIEQFIKKMISLSDAVKTIPILLVGTKADLERRITARAIQRVAEVLKENGLNIVSYISDEIGDIQVYGKWSKEEENLWERGKKWVMTSAKSGEGCTMAFRIIQLAASQQKRVDIYNHR